MECPCYIEEEGSVFALRHCFVRSFCRYWHCLCSGLSSHGCTT
ncbi:unnamed protein product [Rhodiola kirilowii]